LPTIDELRHYETRFAREPSAQAHAALAEAYRRAGRLEEAVRLGREGLERFPGYATTRLVLARALRDADDLVAARAEIERFLDSEPDHEPALRLAVECALRLGEPRRALDHARRLGGLAPQDRGVLGLRRALDVAVGGAGGPEEAGGLWPLLTDDTFATAALGELCVAQGLTDEATAIFGRIALRQPDHAIARARLDELGRPKSPARRPRG
jgi:tetratricopeptide (TPR) repeat protein